MRKNDQLSLFASRTLWATVVLGVVGCRFDGAGLEGELADPGIDSVPVPGDVSQPQPGSSSPGQVPATQPPGSQPTQPACASPSLPRSENGITIREARLAIDGGGDRDDDDDSSGSGTVLAAPGQSVKVRIRYTIVDCSCPNCIDQIEIGYASRDQFEYCAYSAVPGCQGQSGEHEQTLVAPTTPGVYELRFGLRQDYGCTSRTWWQGAPPASRSFASICVASPQ